MENLTTVEFLKTYSIYHAGMIATFPDDVAARMLALNVAKLHKPGTSPIAKVRDVASKMIRKST